jgi:hypothetical protein
MEWISLKKEKPEHLKKVIFGSRLNQESFIGYINQYGLFDEKGNGKSASHWQPFVLPPPPTIEP